MGVTETLFAVGNGYLGLRGNQLEGRFAHEHGTFINGFHETFPIRHAEQAYGFAEVGQTIINAPDAKVMRRLRRRRAAVARRRRRARVRALARHARRRAAPPHPVVHPLGQGGARSRTTRLVSFEEKHLAILRLDVTVLNADARSRSPAS